MRATASGAAAGRLRQQVGVAEDLFQGWEGHELALYKDVGGRSATLEVAQRIASEKVARQDWILDLGNRAASLPRAQGESLRMKLDKAGIPYDTGSVLDAYWRRVHRVTTDHQDILRDLSNR